MIKRRSSYVYLRAVNEHRLLYRLAWGAMKAIVEAQSPPSIGRAATTVEMPVAVLMGAVLLEIRVDSISSPLIDSKSLVILCPNQYEWNNNNNK